MLKVRIALNGTPMTELRDVTCRMGSHSVTWYPTQLNASRPNSSPQAGTPFTYPVWMEGWVDLGYPAMERPGVELATCQSQARRPTTTTTPPTHPYAVVWRWSRCSSSLSAELFSRAFWVLPETGVAELVDRDNIGIGWGQWRTIYDLSISAWQQQGGAH